MDYAGCGLSAAASAARMCFPVRHCTLPCRDGLSPALLYRQRITRGVDCATMQAFELLDDWQSHGAEVPAAWVGHTEFVLRAVHVPRGAVEWLPRDSG